MTSRIYAVRPKSKEAPDSAVRLIRATNPAQVGRHVVKDTLDIAVTSQDDIVSALSNGVKVEDANAEPGDPTTSQE